MTMRITAVVFIVSLVTAGFGAKGGLRLTGRGLVAVPQKENSVFVTWRCLVQDGDNASYSVFRSSGSGIPAKIGSATATSTYRDNPGQGTFSYYIVPESGSLKGVKSNSFTVTTDVKGRDWVELFPGTKGKKVQLGNMHFADTDGDGELEFITHNPRSNGFWPSPLTSGTFKVEIYEMFEGSGPKWSYDTKCGPSGTPYNHHSQFHPTAFDINGDYKAEIITMTAAGRYEVLSDEGSTYKVIGSIAAGPAYNAFADLGGTYYAFLNMGSSTSAYEYNGSTFVKKWTSSGASSGDSHSQTVFDMDGDGKDEFANALHVFDDNGKLLWTANDDFGGGMGSVMEISDIHPGNPGFEIVMTIENAGMDKPYHFGLFDTKTGKPLWLRKSKVCGDIQVAFAAEVSGGSGLDIMATDCGHYPKAGLGITYDGKYIAWPFDPVYPMISFDLGSMDWLGERGYETRVLNKKIYGKAGRLLYTTDLSDCVGCTVPQAPGASSTKGDWLNDKVIMRYWNNLDLIGDYREELIFGMPDGSIRVYLNSQDPPARKVAKLQYRSYEKFQAISSRQGFAKPLGRPVSIETTSVKPTSFAAPGCSLQAARSLAGASPRFSLSGRLLAIPPPNSKWHLFVVSRWVRDDERKGVRISRSK